jgi:hydrogenase maturation protease
MRISVLGMGNVLMGDDGAGPYAVATFTARYQVPGDVTLLDIGTPGLDLVPHLSQVDTLLLVDTVRSDAEPGSIRTYDKTTLLRAKLPPRLSPHDPAVGQCLAMLEIAGCGPREVQLIGIVPQRTAFGPGLSQPVQNAIPSVVERIADELRARGVGVEARTSPHAPDLWWERPAEVA